ncbi:hypothetical protein ANCCAN_08148 [Ancylostoma caninum]|uniref:Uncharacterized protein n=1 Tax=Ancylostoma caninum TaxID=29170 RepID=A0A368GNB1_ANCCA|nr:hypothetical protein ANCCAN_08148 [Ancylostoma caninum]
MASAHFFPFRIPWRVLWKFAKHETTTVEWATETTQNPCGETDPRELVKTMKDSGIYNEIYMAPDIFTASRNFPDLAGKSFMKAKSRYHCDEKCER